MLKYGHFFTYIPYLYKKNKMAYKVAFKKGNKVTVNLDTFKKDQMTPFNIKLNPNLTHFETKRKEDIENPNSWYNNVINSIENNEFPEITYISTRTHNGQISLTFPNGKTTVINGQYLIKI
jgi:hypothetical protein